jgi:hypothetical protein
VRLPFTGALLLSTALAFPVFAQAPARPQTRLTPPAQSAERQVVLQADTIE